MKVFTRGADVRKNTFECGERFEAHIRENVNEAYRNASRVRKQRSEQNNIFLSVSKDGWIGVRSSKTLLGMSSTALLSSTHTHTIYVLLVLQH